MTRETMKRITWHGMRSVVEIEDLLQRRLPVEVQLPPDFHHAVLTRLGPQEKGSDAVDRSGGPELLVEIASITGLGDLAALSGTASRLNARIRIISPGPIISIELPEK